MANRLRWSGQFPSKVGWYWHTGFLGFGDNRYWTTPALAYYDESKIEPATRPTPLSYFAWMGPLTPPSTLPLPEGERTWVAIHGPGAPKGVSP